MPLSPRNLYDAAVRDLSTVRTNSAVRQDRKTAKSHGASSRLAGATRATGFMPKHIRGQTTALGILRAALDDYRTGSLSKDRLQAALYDYPALVRAVQLAEELERGPAQEVECVGDDQD